MKPPIRQRKPNRMPRYDYSARGCYFVTICIKNKETNSFGKIADGKIEFSLMGETASKCWLEIPNHFPYVRLDEFVIMPDHVHGILVITKNPWKTLKENHEIYKNEKSSSIGNADLLPSLNFLNESSRFNSIKDPIDRTKMVLSKVIHAFKSSVTREINKTQDYNLFSWQKSFYDHIIHTQKELYQIRKYISENPIHDKEEPFSEIENL
jgi:putative transposase